MEDSFVKTPEEVCSYFGVNPALGLNKEEVKQSQERYGKNGKS
jgi:Ca2+ transporting ATPase